MATVSRVSTLRLDDTATHVTNILQWVSSAAIQDTAAGLSVDITTVRTVAGVPPADPDTLTLSLYTDTGVLIKSFALGVATASQVSSFFFTADGLSTGAIRSGTVEIAIRATRTSVGTYDVETDATPNTPPATFDSHLDRGWIRGTTTASTVLPSSGTLAYGTTLTATTTLGAAPFVSRTVTVTLAPLSAVNSAGSTTTAFTTALGVVDNRFPASSAARTTALTFPNATLTGQPWTTATLTETTRTIDPRITFTHILQIDNNTYSTTPTTNTSIDAMGQRLTATLGFLASRAVDANGVGINGLVVDIQLWDASALVYTSGRVLSSGATTATKGTEIGWTDISGTAEFATWSDSLPGGAWNYKVAITTSAATGLELTNTRTLTLIASDPRIHVLMAAGDTDNPKKHWSTGQKLVVGCGIINNGAKIAFDAGTFKFFINRFNAATGTTEYLTNPGLTWTTGLTPDLFTMAPSPGDAKIALYTFTATQTSTFNNENLIIVAQVNTNSTPYFGRYVMEVVDSNNAHDGYSFDPIGGFR